MAASVSCISVSRSNILPLTLIMGACIPCGVITVYWGGVFILSVLSEAACAQSDFRSGYRSGVVGPVGEAVTVLVTVLGLFLSF